MKSDKNSTKKKHPVRRAMVISLLMLIFMTGIFLYYNFNQLLSKALLKSFSANIVSDVYELKFEKLRVNLLDESVKVIDVLIQPREKPTKNYPYINSSFKLKTDRLELSKVEIWRLLRYNVLRLEEISIVNPTIEVIIADLKPKFFPFADSITLTDDKRTSDGKKAIESFFLDRFQLVHAVIRTTNNARKRSFGVSDFNLSFDHLMINQTAGMDHLSIGSAALSIGEFKGNLRDGPIRRINFKDYRIGIDSLDVHASVDTAVYQFDNFTAGLHNLEVQTADSLFRLALQSFDLSYKEKSLKLTNVSFKPNISEAAMQRRFKFQHTSASGTVGSVLIAGIDFDKLIYQKSVFIDKVVLDKAKISIFKDNTKPVDKNRIPKYFGQQVSAISIPLLVKEVNVTNVNLINVERKRDSSYAKVNISRGTVSVRNITNRSVKPMTLDAEAYLGNKVHVDLGLGFDYKKPEFSVKAKFDSFSLPDLNPVIEAYTPARINAGTADEITFSGMVYETHASGTMKFLYHDLKVDLNLPKKAKWKSSVIAFAANTILNSSNPGSAKVPARVVQYHVERDMNKGFVNIIIKSALSGIKETMIMSKENKKAYKAAKKQMR